MRKALIALDSLPGAPAIWTFGGGTALAQILDHRVSYDVDIFLDSSTALKNLAPNMNPVTKSLCDTWNWPGKYLKLILREVGEIDFLTAPTYVATKKLKYRASTYTPRDAFDLAAIYLHDREALREVADCPAISDAVLASALNRLNLMKSRYQAEMRDVINPTARGEEFIDRSCEIALEALAELRTLIPKEENEAGNKPL
jgi:hypothetical protein